MGHCTDMESLIRDEGWECEVTAVLACRFQFSSGNDSLLGEQALPVSNGDAVFDVPF